jgi:tetratricopeptide (TPR) repeat protein
VRSDNTDKAVEYLDLANQKAAKLNAMEDARSYFDEAMKLLGTQPDTEGNQLRRISIVVNQVVVFNLLFQIPDYYDLWCQWWIGNYNQAIQTLVKAAELCETSGAFEYAGTAYNNLQWTHLCKGDFEQTFSLKKDALGTTEKQFNLRVYVYAFTAASWACTYLDRWDGAIENGKEALKKAEEFSDNSLISFSASAICLAYCLKGELDRAIEYGELAVQKAPTPADKLWAQGFLAMTWCRTGKLRQGIETLGKVIAAHKKGRFLFGEVGYTIMLGEGYFLAGECDKAIQPFKEGLERAELSGMEWFIGLAHLFLGQTALKTKPTNAVYHFEQSITSYQKIKADPPFMEFLHGIILLTKDNLRHGEKVVEDVSEVFLKNGSMWHYITTERILSTIYLQIVLGKGPKTLPFLAKNIAFLIKSAPRAPEKAEYHLQKVIETAKEIGAKSILGQAYLDLGLLHKAKDRTERAREYITESIQIFEQCEADVFLKEAKEALASLS